MTWKLSNGNKEIEMRAAYGSTLDRLFAANHDLVALDADLASSSGAGGIFAKYPNQSVDVGISEQNMIGVAAGLSLTGLRPYVHSFAPFVTRRVYDQVYTSIAYSQNAIHIYGSDPGYWSLYNGGTHTTFEDLAIMRELPGFNVLVPSDGVTFAWVLEYYAQNGGAFYTRAPRKKLPLIYEEGSTFVLGRANVLRTGHDVVLIAIGAAVYDALQVADRLAQDDNVIATVVDLLSVKPYDEALIARLIQDNRYIVTIENHYQTGGIGDIVASAIATSASTARLRKIGVKERFGEVGELDYLKQVLGLDPDTIYATITKDLASL